MKEKPTAHVTGIVILGTIAEMFPTKLERCDLLVFDLWHIYLGFVATTLAVLLGLELRIYISINNL